MVEDTLARDLGAAHPCILEGNTYREAKDHCCDTRVINECQQGELLAAQCLMT
jgi:hypothetical protein